MKQKSNDVKGFVYLVGGGPGHPGLITQLGNDLLRICDAVVYDDLIAIELIVGLSEKVEKYYVGKRAGKHSKSQDEINSLLVLLAKRGLKVVRLKGGDPVIFGRIGEEISCLVHNQIPFSVVPGVTAASASAAGAGYSLTDRRDASWTLLATGHEAKSNSPAVPWNKIAPLEGGTIVVYMGIGEMERIIGALLENGMDPSTPALINRNAYTGRQHIVAGTIENIVKKSRDENIKPPALLTIGKVVNHREINTATERLPLAGKRILITRPAQQSVKMCNLLRSLGAEPIPYPTILLQPDEDAAGWDRFRECIVSGGWCVFTSEAGVKFFFAQLFKHNLDLRALGRFKLACIGSGTRDALEHAGFKADLIPQRSLVKELALELTGKVDLKGVQVVRVRGNLGDDTIEAATAASGGHVLPLNVYQNSVAVWPENWIRNILSDPPDYIAFTSGSTFSGFCEILGDENVAAIHTKSRFASIGPMTTQIIHDKGYIAASEAKVHNVEGLVQAIVEDSLY